MSTFQIPKGICNYLDAMVRRFWWGAKPGSKRFLALKSWRTICQSKEVGGLGFKKFQDVNLALLSKLGWFIAKGEIRLLVDVMRMKYLNGRSFFLGEWRKGDSLVWKAIMNTREIIRRWACYKMGNRWSIELQNDPWVPGLKRLESRVPEGLFEYGGGRVENLINWDTYSWNLPIIESIFNREEVAAILKLKLPEFYCDDRLCWIASKDGKFSVKSCFAIIQGSGSAVEKDKV